MYNAPRLSVTSARAHGSCPRLVPTLVASFNLFRRSALNMHRRSTTAADNYAGYRHLFNFRGHNGRPETSPRAPGASRSNGRESRLQGTITALRRPHLATATTQDRRVPSA